MDTWGNRMFTLLTWELTYEFDGLADAEMQIVEEATTQ
jgi:hypothetical protein